MHVKRDVGQSLIHVIRSYTFYWVFLDMVSFIAIYPLNMNTHMQIGHNSIGYAS